MSEKIVDGVRFYHAREDQPVLGVERLDCPSCIDQPSEGCEICLGNGYSHAEYTQADVDGLASSLRALGLAPEAITTGCAAAYNGHQPTP